MLNLILRFYITTLIVAFLFLIGWNKAISAGSILDFLVVSVIYLPIYTFSICILHKFGINKHILTSYKQTILFSFLPFLLLIFYKMLLYLFCHQAVIPANTNYTIPWYKDDNIIVVIILFITLFIGVFNYLRTK